MRKLIYLFTALTIGFVSCEKETFEDELNAANEEIALLKQQLREQAAEDDATITSLEAQLRDLQSSSEADATRINELLAQLDELHAEIADLNSQLDNGGIDVTQYTDAIAALEEEIKSLEQQVTNLSIELQTANALIATLTANAGDSAATIASLQASLTASQIEASELASDVLDLETRLASYTASNTALLASNEALQAQVDSLTASLTATQSDLDDALADIDELEADLKVANDALDAKIAELASVQAKLDASQISEAEAKDKVAELEGDISDLNDSISTLNSTLNEKNAKIAELNAEIASLNAKVDELTDDSCEHTEFEAIDEVFDEDDYLVMPDADYTEGTVSHSTVVTRTTCIDGVASVVSATYKLEVVTTKLGSNTESGWGFDESQNDDDDLIDNVDKVEITLKYYIDGTEDDDLETSADWFVVVKNNTEVKVCAVVTYDVDDAKAWVETLVATDTGAVGSYSKTFTNVASDCTETNKISNANVIKQSLNYSELSHGVDYNNDGDMNDTVKLEWFLASWSFDGKTYQLAGAKSYAETVTDVDGETVNLDIYLKGSHVYTKSTNTADDGTLTLTYVIDEVSKRMDGVSANATVQINGVGSSWNWSSSKTWTSGVTATATEDTVADTLTIKIDFDVDEATDVSIQFVAE